MKRLLLISMILVASAAAATTVNYSFIGPTGGDIQLCSDQALTQCSATAIAIPMVNGIASVYVKSGCVLGNYTISMSAPGVTPAAYMQKIVAGPLAKLVIVSGDNQSVPVRSTGAALTASGSDTCGNTLP